jgi:hypothetical protein
MRARIYAAVEGKTDKVVVERLIAHVGAEAGPVYVAEGKPNLKKRIAGYNQAAQHSLWLVLVDLDRDGCAPSLRDAWLPEPSSGLCFRVAVHAVEAWLMADAETLAGFLGVARSNIPVNPESVPDPKAVLVELAAGSHRRDIREDMVPQPGSSRRVGPAYTSRIIEYAGKHWHPDTAALQATSLERAIRCLRRLAAGALSPTP